MTDQIRDGFTYRMPWHKWEDKPNLKISVTMKCIDCVSGPTSDADLASTNPLSYVQGINAAYKAEIKACPVKDCSLWNHRPYKLKAGNSPAEEPEESEDTGSDWNEL